MSTAEKRKPLPEDDREAFLDGLPPPARRCMRTMCATEDGAARWYNTLSDTRAAIKIGVEVMEASAREKAQKAGHPTPEANFAMQAASYALGAVTAIECCMAGIELMQPLLIKAKQGEEPLQPDVNGFTLPDNGKIRRLDLD